MAKEPEMREKWQHRPGDAYVPVFGDWVGGLAVAKVALPALARALADG